MPDYGFYTVSFVLLTVTFFKEHFSCIFPILLFFLHVNIPPPRGLLHHSIYKLHATRKTSVCMFISRSLRKEGCTQVEIDHLFKAIVLPKITYALLIYVASQVDLNTIQCFFKRYNKRRCTSELINIYDLLEKCDRRLFTKIKNNINHPLYQRHPTKVSS